MNRLKDLEKNCVVVLLNTEDESWKSIPVREMDLKLKKLLREGGYVKLGASIVVHVLNVGIIASNRDVEMLINMIKEVGVDLEKKGALEEVQFHPQHYILIGYKQKGMNQFDISSVPSGYSKMFASFKQIIQKITAESSIPSYMSYVVNEEWLANPEDTAWRDAWINPLRNQHLPSVEDTSNLLLKLLDGENIFSIQPLKVIEFIIHVDLYSRSSKSNITMITTVHEAAILKLLQVYEFPIKEKEKHCTSLILSASRLKEWVNIYPYRSELLRHLIAYPTNLLEKSKEILNAVQYWKNHTIRSNNRNGGLRTCEIAEYQQIFAIICLILDFNIFSTNMHTLKQHWKTLHRSIIECVFCDMNDFIDLLRNLNIGAHFSSYSNTALNSIHRYQQINLSELRIKSNVHDQLIEYLSTTKHSEYMAVALTVLDTYKSFPIETYMKIHIDEIIKSVCPSEMLRIILEIENGDLLLLTYLDSKHIQLQEQDQWNILESVVGQLFLYNNNLCTSAIVKYIKSRDIIEIMMGTEINELSFDVHVLTKHILLPILLEIQDKKEKKQRSLQWNNSCDAKHRSIMNFLLQEQTIKITNRSIFTQDLSQIEVLTNSKLKEQKFLEFIESNYNELDRTSCHGHDEIKSLSLFNSSCHKDVEKTSHKDVEKTNLLKKMEDITRKGYQSCLGFLEIDTRENLYKSLTKAIYEHNYLQFCKDKELQCSTERWSYRQPYSKQKDLCQRKNCYIQIGDILCGCEMKNISTKHKKCKGLENLCSDETCNIHVPNKNKTKLFSLEEIAVSNSSKHILFEDFQSEHIPLVKEGRVTACQFTLAERCNAVLGITFTLTQCMIAFLQNILQRNDCKQQGTDCKQQGTDYKQHETVCNIHETDCKQQGTEEHVRKQTATNLCLVFGIISCIQILKNIVKEKENVNIQFSKKLQKLLSIHGNRKHENIIPKDKLMDLFDILQLDNSKCIKSELYNIINHNSIFRNDEITAYPVNGYNGMSNEILRVGSLNNFPSENSPSLIKLAKYGFYYEGKGREVTCFSCGIKHDDWSYRSNPLEVHRQISPYCEYLKTLTHSDQPVFRPPIEIIESDNRQSGTPRLPTTDIPYLNGIGTDSIHTCTDAHGTPMTVAVQSVDSGLFGSSLSHSSNNLVTSNSTSISSISQRSSRTSTDSGFGSRGSISTDHSSSSNHTSNLAVPQLPPLPEGGEHSIQKVSAPASRDSPAPQNNRKNTPKEKYPEYIPIERRRATYKNWPPNLDFLHPLDLSECGFFYSNFGDCVRCFHCGIGLRNWESDDNPWVEHARWSRKCPYLLQRKGQEFIDSVLSVLGLQTDSEIEMQTANAGTEPASQVSSGYGTASSNDVRDPVCHPAAQYIIRENIFGDNKEKQVKKTMNQLLQNHEWNDISNDMLVNALLESKDIMENLDTKTNSLNLSESAVSKSSASSDSKTPSTGTEDKNKEKEIQKSAEDDPDKIQKENEELKDLYTCKICLDERVGITFVPCGHLVTCKDCSPKIRRCPLCRTFIRGTIKTTM